jgi:hypothetical protein
MQHLKTAVVSQRGFVFSMLDATTIHENRANTISAWCVFRASLPVEREISHDKTPLETARGCNG